MATNAELAARIADNAAALVIDADVSTAFDHAFIALQTGETIALQGSSFEIELEAFEADELSAFVDFADWIVWRFTA
jgi:hypothetical protein